MHLAARHLAHWPKADVVFVSSIYWHWLASRPIVSRPKDVAPLLMKVSKVNKWLFQMVLEPHHWHRQIRERAVVENVSIL